MARAPSPAEGKSSGALVLVWDMTGEEGLLSCAAAICQGQRLSSAESVRPGEECLAECNMSFAIFQRRWQDAGCGPPVVVSLDTLGSFPDFTTDENRRSSLSKILSLGT